MPYIGKKPADIIATVIDTTTGTFSGEVDAGSLDVSGNADIDGITNLDNTDIDGTLDVSGNLTVDTNTLYVDSANNRVGVGTSSPLSKLQILGGTSGLDQLSLSSTLTNNTIKYAGVIMTNYANTTTALLGGKAENGTTSIFYGSSGTDHRGPQNHIFYTNSSSTATSGNTERMRIDSSGKVGIGTSVAPAQKLTVTGVSGAAVGGLTNGILSLTTGTGAITDTRMLFGIVDDNYAWIQPADYGVAYRNLILNPNGGNVGIGTSSPNAPLNVNGTVELAGVLYRGIFGGTYQDSDIGALTGGNPSAVQIQSPVSNRPATLLLGGSQGTGELLGTIGFYNSGNTDTKRLRSYIYGSQEGGTSNQQGGVLVFGTASDAGTTPTQRMRIDSSGRVGIATNSPANTLHIIGTSATPSLRLGSISLTNYWDIGRENATTGDFIFSQSIAGSVSERMRIDSSGNLLVGTTETVPGIANTTSGISLRGGSGAESIVVSRGGGISGYFNRNSDGAILQLRKDGSAVGSIGTAGGGAFYISDSTYGGLGFSTLGAGDINPVNTTGGIRDNAMDLGQPTARFKDLYLSGGVYLGGTGSANKLDDYEEGTWNPSLTPSNGSFTSITYQSRDGRYTKIGNIVTISCRLSTTSITVGAGSGNVQITNLPFNTSSSSAPGSALSFNANWASGNPAFAFLLDLSGTVRLHQSVAAGAYNLGTPTTVANLNTGSNNSNYVYFVLTYETT
jgi:hypothetical protein